MLLALAAIVPVSIINTNLAKESFALFSSLGDGTWVHYNQAMPGTVGGTPNGVREYWIRCGYGKESIRFTNPGVGYEEALSYDVSEFETLDPRWIIPVEENEGEYNSVIYNDFNSTAYFNEIDGMSNGFTTEDELPAVGETKKMLWVKDDENPAYYVNTLTVTKIISSKQEMIDLFKLNGSSFAEGEYLDGYYALTSNVDLNYINGQTVIWGTESLSLNRGFIGTFDGRGHTFLNTDGRQWNGGVFGVMNNATIKNINFNHVIFANGAATVLGVAHNCIFKNINVEVSGINSVGNVYEGRLLYRFSCNNLIEKISVKVADGVDIKNLFGGNVYGDNSFFDVTVKADTAPYLATIGTNATSVSDTRGLTFIPNSANYLELDRQDISINDSSALSISTGGVNVGTITSIQVSKNGNTYDLGTDLSNLVIPSELINTPEDHGETALIITNSESTTYALKVVLVTEFISENADLNLIRGTNRGQSIYGYFVLSNDILANYTGEGIGKTNQPNWSTESGNAFYGIFNGRGHRIYGNILNAEHGIFGAVRGMGTVNNLRIDALSHYTGYGNALFGSRVSGLNANQHVSICNVTVDAEIAGANTNRNGQFIRDFIYLTSLKNVTVNISGVYPNSSEVSLLPAYYPTGNNSFNHVIWNTPFASNTHLYQGTDEYDGLITINTPTIIVNKNINIDKNESTYTFDLDASISVTSVEWNDSVIGNSKTINTSAFGSRLGETSEITIFGRQSGHDIIAKYHPTLCSKVIRTASDLDTFLSIADAANGEMNDQIYDGYFVLDNDISYDGIHEPQMQDISTGNDKQEYGFRGIFDGQNHIIDNFSIRSYGNDEYYNRVIGLISRLHKNGIIRNLGFTNATVGNCALICGWGEGTCENIYVHYKAQTPWSAYFATFNNTISGPKYGMVTVKNCLIDARNITKGSERKVVGDSWDHLYSYKGVYCLVPTSDYPVIRRATEAEAYIDDSDASHSAKGQELSTSNVYDVVNGYTNYGDLLKECGTDIDSWSSFSYKNNSLYFGDTLITTTAANTYSSHNFIDDYTVVCDTDDFESAKAANLIVNHLYRAGSTVQYTKLTDINSYRYAKRYSGGTLLNKVGNMTYASNKNLIVVGNRDLEEQVGITVSECKITTIDNSIFLSANENKDLLAVAIEFLKQAVGFKALSDETIFYEKEIDGIMPTINESFKVSFKTRGRNNYVESYGYDMLGFNGVMTLDEFTVGPINSETGNMQVVHNSLQWLPRDTYATAHPNWYWSPSTGNYDICFTAHGNASELTAMVNETASLMRQALIEHPEETKLTFSIQDNSYTNCSCSACSSSCSTHSDHGAYAAVSFMNQVAERIVALDTQNGITNRDFTLYVLGYYYLFDAPTGIEMNDHVGVMIAPMNDSSVINAYEARSIYDSRNASAKEAIEKWCNLTENITFWYYCQNYSNYFTPFDNFDSTMGWLEHIYYLTNGSCKMAYVQGQSTYTQSCFQSFKQYLYSRALIDIANHVNKRSEYASSSDYTAAIKSYVSILENEFFGITSRTNTELTTDNIDSEVANYTFTNNGYFGAAIANKNMFLLYRYERLVYQNLLLSGTAKHNAGNSVMYGSCQEKYDYLVTSNYKTCGSSLTSINSSDFFTSNSTKTYYYCANFTSATLTKEMGYYEAAWNAISSYSDPALEIYKRHIILESLSPRYFICMANTTKSNYGFYNGYNGDSLATLRSSFKSDCELVYFTKLSEHIAVSVVFTKWGL